jgi:putative glutamine amidotransferase
MAPRSYAAAVQAAGALALLFPPDDAVAEEPALLLDRIDALVLAGGSDVDPATYGAPRHPETSGTRPERDRFEVSLARAALERQMPVLGICRGMQVLNVARGGTLHQHLPDLGGEIEHRQQLAGPRTTHEVELSSTSRLARLLGLETLAVNSFHHQAIDALGGELHVVGRAADGVIEAVETSGPGFVVGVQWHAEGLVERPEQLTLFEALVRAASEHADEATQAA